MKKLLAALLILWAGVARANCTTGAFPFQLQNNTLADATQVMANFNQVTTGITANCAGSGVNNDITSLNALTTPITPAQGGTNLFAGPTAGGSANALTIAVSSNFTLTAGNRVAGIVALNNTGPTTLQANATTNLPFQRKTQLGLQNMNGGELIAGNPFLAVYTGSAWVLEGEVQLVGEMRMWMAGLTPPPQHLIADGSSFACASFPALCTVLGTTYGGTASNPNLPDTRGRVLAGLDNYGTAPGAASRLTNAATGCGTTMNGMNLSCANSSQSHTQLGTEVGVHNHTITDPGHTHSYNNPSGGAAGFNNGGAGGQSSSTGSNTTGITINNTAAPTAMPIVNPNLGVVMVIHY